MKKIKGFLLEIETIKKIGFLAQDKSMSENNYLTDLVEKDWIEVIHNSPFAEAIVKEVTKDERKFCSKYN